MHRELRVLNQLRIEFIGFLRNSQRVDDDRVRAQIRHQNVLVLERVHQHLVRVRRLLPPRRVRSRQLPMLLLDFREPRTVLVDRTRGLGERGIFVDRENSDGAADEIGREQRFPLARNLDDAAVARNRAVGRSLVEETQLHSAAFGIGFVFLDGVRV